MKKEEKFFMIFQNIFSLISLGLTPQFKDYQDEF